MQQLTLLIHKKRLAPVEDVVLRIRALGWEPDPTYWSSTGRWWLPGTVYRLKTQFHTTTIYRLIDRQAHAMQRYRTANLTAILLALEHLSLVIATTAKETIRGTLAP